jgi:hypothetical protein
VRNPALTTTLSLTRARARSPCDEMAYPRAVVNLASVVVVALDQSKTLPTLGALRQSRIEPSFGTTLRRYEVSLRSPGPLEVTLDVVDLGGKLVATSLVELLLPESARRGGYPSVIIHVLPVGTLGEEALLAGVVAAVEAAKAVRELSASTRGLPLHLIRVTEADISSETLVKAAQRAFIGASREAFVVLPRRD